MSRIAKLSKLTGTLSALLPITAAGLISGRPRQGWRVFCQSRQMGEKSFVKAKLSRV